MSDEEQEAVQVSADEEEIVVVDELPAEKKEEKEAEPDPELVKLREENAKLKKDGDTSAAIKDGFSFLKDRLDSAGVPAQPPAPVEDEEEFWKKVEEGLFDKQPREALKKAINKEAMKIVREQVGPVLLSQMESAFENAEWRLRNDARDGPIFAKYEAEVYRELKKLNPVQQKDPRELRAAYGRVKSEHVEEIIAERMLAEQETVEKKPVPAARPRVLMEGAAAHPGPAVKKQPMITRADHEKVWKKGMSDKAYLDLLEYRKTQK